MNDENMESRVNSLESWRADMDRRFAEAFPGGDHIGHCRYHQLMIESIEEKKRLRAAVLEKTIGGLVWATICATGLALWKWIVNQVRGG